MREFAMPRRCASRSGGPLGLSRDLFVLRAAPQAQLTQPPPLFLAFPLEPGPKTPSPFPAPLRRGRVRGRGWRGGELSPMFSGALLPPELRGGDPTWGRRGGDSGVSAVSAGKMKESACSVSAPLAERHRSAKGRPASRPRAVLGNTEFASCSIGCFKP